MAKITLKFGDVIPDTNQVVCSFPFDSDAKAKAFREDHKMSDYSITPYDKKWYLTTSL